MANFKPIEFYSSRKKNAQKNIDQFIKQKKKYTILRGIVFITAVIFFIYFLNKNQIIISITTTTALLSVFIFLVKLATKKNQNLYFEQQKLKNINNELQTLKFDFSAFSAGEKFINPQHKFSFDLDIFGNNSIYQILNRTKTRKGNNKLASKLNNPLLSPQEITNVQDAVKELIENHEKSVDFQANAAITAQEENKINENISDKISNFPQSKFSRKIWNIFLKIQPFISILIIFLASTNLITGKLTGLYFAIMLIISVSYIKYINKIHAQTTKLSKVLKKYALLLKFIENQEFNSNLLKEKQKKLKINNLDASELLKNLSRLTNNLDNRLNIVFAIATNGLFLWDIQIVNKIETWYKKYAHKIDQWIEVIADYEFLISLSTFHFNNPDYTFPKISENFTVEIKNIGHPIINSEKLVKNDFEIKNNLHTFIITGANMAGKSTFLRTIGVNFILAQIGSVVCADSMLFSPLNIHTSIRITDSLANDKSYFYAELVRLKNIINEANNNNTLIIIDEMLRGTNSVDKHKGSEGFLKKLIDKNVITILATHDVQLGKLENQFGKKVKNFCFEAEISNDELIFDYKLQEGVSKNLNASYLMKKMGII